MKTLKLFLCLWLAVLAPRLASALIVGPYTPDTNTLFLFHFDEAAGGTVTTNVGTKLGNAYTVTNTWTGNGLAAPPTVNDMLGAPGFAGFGNALTNTSTSLGGGTNSLVGYDANKSGAFDGDVSLTGPVLSADAFAMTNLNMGLGGASPFTIELMICPLVTNRNQEVVCTDSSAGSRGLQFKLTSAGTINFNAIATGPNITVAIPSSGTHAFVPGTWYHLAATYDGANVRIYWTKVDPAITQANLINTTASTAINATFGAATGPLVIGNENRNSVQECFIGKIDEVRISKVARDAGQMLFGSALVSLTQQPVVQEGVDYGGTGRLSVSATSLLPLSYQWRLNGNPIPDATNSTYTFSNAVAANAGNYVCVITNSNPSSATSSVAVVSIGAANFLAHRYGFTNDVTDSFGTANGTLFGNANVSGGALQLDGTTGTYLSLPAGLVTNQAAITIESWASFATIANNSFFFGFGDTNGANGRYYIFMTPHGTAARIAITAADPGFNGEQIANSGVNLDNRTGVQIVSVFAPYLGYEALYTNGVLAAINTNVTAQLSSVVNNYSFIGRSLYSGDPYLTGSVDEFRIYNGAMSASSIQQSYLQGPDNGLSSGPVQILVSPTNTTVAANQVATFSGLASGLPPISYQWFKNNALIAGATNASYAYAPTFADNNAGFKVVASNNISGTAYTATSSVATLTVLVPATLAWLGASDNLWNNSSLNWSNAAQQLVAYAEFDGAVFDQRGANQPNVDLQQSFSPVSVTVSNSTPDYLIYSSANSSLTVLGTLVKQGSGKFTIDVTNNSTGLTFVQNGILQVGNGDNFGTLGSGPVTNNATLSFNRSDAALTVGNAIHGTGPVSFDGYGTVTVTGTNDYTGSTLINAGVANLKSAAGLGDVSVGTTVANGAQLYITANVDVGAEALTLNGVGGDGSGALRKGGAGATTYSGPLTLATDATIGVDGGATLTLNSPLGISGAVTLTKNGGGTLALNATNYYAATTLTAGVINVNTNGALGTGPVTANSTGRFVIGTGLTITNDFTANGVNPGAATGFIMVADNTNGIVTTVSGPIALNVNPASGGHFIGPFASGYLNIAGPVTMPGGTFMVVRDGRVRFANSSSSYPEIQVRANTTSLGLNNGVATNAVMDLAGNGTAFFDLNGFNQTLAGLKNTVTPGNAALGFVTNSSATLKTLTLDLGEFNFYSFGGNLVGKLSVVLKSGTQVLTGANAYTGNTTVTGGTLEIGQARIATNSTVSVASGAVLQLDFSGVTNQIGGLVLNGVAQVPGVYDSTTSSPFLAGPGSLLVVNPVATNPTNITSSVSGNLLTLSWPADHTGWRLQVQTNALAAGLSTNWVAIPGTDLVNSTNLTINPANGAVFYRLIYP
jgi:autotransporter-associated beta strand protein